MKTLYDVQQLLKRFGVFIHLGQRSWDIELMAIELDNLLRANVIDKQTFLAAKRVLVTEHEAEEQWKKKTDKIFKD
ncbi:YqgQ family protein [Ligilactobacillus ceti]|uniref:Cytosolic protein n=1 Tax=Ligilactobacillus ceti DSM 22408 TaxID=1122146 RepID=A0A0R2KH16_9LACO|nr:YqgQ family protein [Ligilactobacillus ceti]KRN88571.1 hypothetical protein IV53_GL000536 [Ligilactobacillus ceti DSM 22408]